VALRQAVVDRPALRTLPVLWTPSGRRPGEPEHDRGAAVGRAYRWQTAAGARPEVALRVLGVASTPLAKPTAPRWAAAHQAAPPPRVARQPPGPRRTCAWEAAAHQAARWGGRALALPRPHLPVTRAPAGIAARRTTRGRPPTGAPRPQRQVWRGTWPGPEAPDAINRRAQRARRWVRATTGLAAPPRADADLRRADPGPPAGALSCPWAKTPAALAPIGLETPTRLAALGCGDVIAPLVDPLVAWHGRNGLAERRETLPDRPAPRPQPTARPVCSRRRTRAVVTLPWARRAQPPGTLLHAHQPQVLRLL
jgi:hypothetical protein